MKNNRQEKGITLIALIITIIVLLILAGIILAMVVGDNGIIAKAGTAKNKTNESQQAELDQLQDYEDKLEGTTRGSKMTFTKLWQYDPNASDANNGRTIGTITLNGNIDDYDAVRVSAQMYDGNGPYGTHYEMVLKDEYYQDTYYGQSEYFQISMSGGNWINFGFKEKTQQNENTKLQIGSKTNNVRLVSIYGVKF